MTQTAKTAYVQQTKENRKRIEMAKAISALVRLNNDRRIK